MDATIVARQRAETLASLSDHLADATRRGDYDRAGMLARTIQRITGQPAR